MEENMFGNFFAQRDFTLQTFTYSDLEQPYKASCTAATDYDLTGQVLWPASQILSKFIIDNSMIFKGKSVLEVGAGAGLCSLVASHYAKSVLGTDYKDLVLDLLKENLGLYGSKNCIRKTALLDWKSTKVTELLEYPNNEKIGEEELRGIDYVLGSDVFYWDTSIIPLYNTLNVLYLISVATL